jgi:hypothetical protein
MPPAPAVVTARESLITIGRVEVEVNNRPSAPAAPPRSKPSSAEPASSLEARYLSRFALRR